MDSHSNSVLLPGGVGDIDIDSWGFGKATDAIGETGFVNGQNIESMTRAESLVSRESTLTNKPSFFTRRRPSYATLGDNQLVDVKAYGAKGDGTSDETAVLNSILDFAANISAVAWPQIMATGSLFADMSSPRAAVRVGDEGSVDAVEIQCMMFTVKGPTAGAVLMEWNIHESSQGSAGLWDSPFRVGGAIGSDLQVENCPTKSQNDGCVAASMLMHVTTKASAYLENVWMWIADHDMDKVSQHQINIFSARGVLIESQGPTWLWVSPAAPAPFSNGLVFANDPDFRECGSSKSCAMSGGLRPVDSSTVYILSTGLYTWFQNYDQTCINSGQNTYQDRIFYAEQSYDIWIYGLVTIGHIEMITPFQGTPIVARNNRNGYASSILAWLSGSDQTAGLRNFTGYRLYTLDKLDSMSFSHEQLCDVGCGQSLASWYDGVSKCCGYYKWPSGAPLDMLGGYVWYGYNEMCSKDPVTGKFCSDVIDDFSLDDADGTIPTPYSIFGTFPWFEELLESTVAKCSIKVPTTPQDPLFPKANSTGFCVSDDWYTTQSGDTCNSIALAKGVSSADIFLGNPDIYDCTALEPGRKLCIPLQCKTYLLRGDDDCLSTSINAGVADITLYNTWINSLCDNLHSANATLGSVLFTSPAGGDFVPGPATNTSGFPGSKQTGYGSTLKSPAEGATVAPGTTLNCGGWHVVEDGESCGGVTMESGISLTLFQFTNPSVEVDSSCDASLHVGNAYCVAPLLPEAPPADDGPITVNSYSCWSSNANSPVLLKDSTTDDAMTVESCARFCRDGGYPFLGLQNSDTCLCGDKVAFNSYEDADAEFNMPCKGLSSQVCGGTNASSLFSLGDIRGLVFDYRYLGCFADKKGSSALVGQVLHGTSNTGMSVEVCEAFCVMGDNPYGYQFYFFGLEFGNTCYCGDTVSKTVETQLENAKPLLSDSDCSATCTGDSFDTCGGQDIMQLYGIVGPS
ncbi:hypothetical protein CMUS01_14800 [Colletotrichum musicola]|uniref:LysM domain-containing protein n=1 Tax=Colletotrichum musicola TaxID=2175873 RepID=A0A8H6J200_9PEZI|nr:hypothetical protein CMUS01_14800 [Colletotrichum musicola]